MQSSNCKLKRASPFAFAICTLPFELFFDLFQYFPILIGQISSLKKVRPLDECRLERLAPAPPVDIRMISRKEHVRDHSAEELCRPRIMRMVKQPVAEGIPVSR